ncbi:MAG: hypothetical protein ACRDRU_00800 [Pseudonocardiaceae bacterium]
MSTQSDRDARVTTLASQDLPEVWVGSAAEKAGDVVVAVAAGHSVDEVSNFDNLIHNHGDDPGWLSSSRREPRANRDETRVRVIRVATEAPARR